MTTNTLKGSNKRADQLKVGDRILYGGQVYKIDDIKTLRTTDHVRVKVSGRKEWLWYYGHSSMFVLDPDRSITLTKGWIDENFDELHTISKTMGFDSVDILVKNMLEDVIELYQKLDTAHADGNPE